MEVSVGLARRSPFCFPRYVRLVGALRGTLWESFAVSFLSAFRALSRGFGEAACKTLPDGRRHMAPDCAQKAVASGEPCGHKQDDRL